jgi:hypothetical protein
LILHNFEKKDGEIYFVSNNITGEANGLIYTHAEYADIETKVLIS